MRILIDTNVYLEFLLAREKYEIAKLFFDRAALYKSQTFITTISLRDIKYVAHRFYHDSSISKKIQFYAYKMTSKVASISADAAIESLYSDNTDYEDSLQIIAAEESMVDAIITFDKKGYKESKLPVYTPEEIVNIWDKYYKAKWHTPTTYY